ncbi:GNAT family N-acetyltransferase [Kitasatospora sp. CB01950]|uniref:GNAT family N-acetyltransferase n=1 Tax=Kitasatospora sp. CB01950 TaxID=1703930 RepID=UPI00093ECAC8|nr:GNAT family N-acetyltransferase [Kitasatospora sp. CB01950]OKJ15671.1 GNAT family acetyltransferase [Kitasatospora sp. CB01950]
MPDDPTVPALVRAWISGWTVSRGAADPQPEPWGWTIDVGQYRHPWRHVLPAPVEADVRTLTEGTTVPWTWLKLFGVDEHALPWIGPGWHIDVPGHLMTCRLRPETPAVPAGYRITTWSRGGVIRALVRTVDGEYAARGQIGVGPGIGRGEDPVAVVDQVETAPEHRRRGLGSLLMRTLQSEAHAEGARTGLLVGTTQGRALYATLGWQWHAPMLSLWYDPSTPSDLPVGGS